MFISLSRNVKRLDWLILTSGQASDYFKLLIIITYMLRGGSF